MQIWPLFDMPHCTAMLAARSRSASRSTIIGSLPPSSSETGVSVSAARASTFLPVAVEPVNMIMSAWSTSAAPVSPRPVATRKASSVPPTARNASCISSEVSGVTSLGLSTTLLPATRAGSASPKLFVSG